VKLGAWAGFELPDLGDGAWPRAWEKASDKKPRPWL
jgi:hypothetical protein